MAIEEIIEFKAVDFVPYYGVKDYKSRTRFLLGSEYTSVVENKIDTLNLLEGAYITAGVGSVFALLAIYFPLK